MSSNAFANGLPSTSHRTQINIMKNAIHNVYFKNWAETFECQPKLFFAPKTEEELQAILALASEEKQNVKVVGCKHSSSDIACTPGIMISMQYFNKIIKINKQKLKVKVQSGMKNTELNDHLYSHNLGLSVLGDLSDITIGGAISVAVHGTGIKYGTLSSYVTRLEMMLPDGSTVILSAKKNADTFYAALCGIGSLGIILNVTLQCEEAFNLELRQYGLSLQDVIENLDVHLSGSDHFSFKWFPHTDNIVVSHARRTTSVANSSKFWNKWNAFWEFSISYAVEFCYYISTFFPHLVPHINSFFYRWFSKESRRVDRSYKIFNVECICKHYSEEWAIPVEKTGLVLWEINEYIETIPETYVHFPIDVRFVRADSIYLSPTYGRDTCYINIVSYRPYGKNMPNTEYWRAFENIMLKSGGRPHWAKANSITSENLKLMYPFFGKWCAIRQRLDPLNLFLNPYMSRILEGS